MPRVRTLGGWVCANVSRDLARRCQCGGGMYGASDGGATLTRLHRRRGKTKTGSREAGVVPVHTSCYRRWLVVRARALLLLLRGVLACEDRDRADVSIAEELAYF